MRQHWHHAVGEIDAIAAQQRLAIELRSFADVETDVGDGDNRVPPVAVGARGGTDGIIMVARILGIDRDDWQMGQILAAIAERHAGYAMRLGNGAFVEFVAQAMLGNRDHREAACRERIAEHRVDPSGHLGRSARGFSQHQVAGARGGKVGDQQFAPLALVDRCQEEAVALAADNTEHHLGRLLELLHDVRDMAAPGFLGPR